MFCCICKVIARSVWSCIALMKHKAMSIVMHETDFGVDYCVFVSDKQDVSSYLARFHFKPPLLPSNLVILLNAEGTKSYFAWSEINSDTARKRVEVYVLWKHFAETDTWCSITTYLITLTTELCYTNFCQEHASDTISQI